MRRILIERARRERAERHGGGRQRVELDQVDPADAADGVDVLALNEALVDLEREAPDAAAVVKLRYFAGLTAQQAADALGQSLRTVNRHWAYARAGLYKHLHYDRPPAT